MDLRRNLQYSLARQGEAAFAGVVHAMSVLASTGALQTAVLDAIPDRLVISSPSWRRQPVPIVGSSTP